MRDDPGADVPSSDAADWRPQLPAPERLRGADVRDPIIEPHWGGIHVLAHFDAERTSAEGAPLLHLVDAEGEDILASTHAALVEELRTAIQAVDAVVDGFLTDEATRTGEGATIAITAQGAGLGSMLMRPPTVDVAEPREVEAGPVAFVAVDLLRVDGQPLFDLPLLERKRLLESVVRQSELVRVGTYARPPLGPWLRSWKAAGFAGAVLKGANSRYRPTTVSAEWSVVLRTPGGR